MRCEKARTWIKDILNHYGYGLVKLPRLDGKKYLPYVRHYQTGPVGFDFWIANETGVSWYDVEGLENGHEAQALLSLVAPGDRVLEVGAHHGFYTMLLTQAVGPSGYVLALEAEPRNAMIAQAQVMLNEKGKNCLVMNCAGSNTPGTLNMTASDGNNTRAADSHDQVNIQVNAVTGDELAQTHGPFNVLKLDVEGFEGKVLEGCKKLLAGRPKLALELHLDLMRHFDTTVEDIWKLIDVEGYQGQMLVFPGTAPPQEFTPNNLPQTHTTNIFLRPR